MKQALGKLASVFRSFGSARSNGNVESALRAEECVPDKPRRDHRSENARYNRRFPGRRHIAAASLLAAALCCVFLVGIPAMTASAVPANTLEDPSHLLVTAPLDVDPAGSLPASLGPELLHVAVLLAAPLVYLAILAGFRLKKRWFALVLPMMILASSLQGATVEENRFLWEQAEVQMTLAKAPADFLCASRTYRRLIRNDVRNAHVYYNLGTSLLGANQPEQALHALERAERYAGGRRDIRHNMEIASAALRAETRNTTRWHRLFLFWHFFPSTPARITIAVCAYAGIWIALSLRLFGLLRVSRVVFTVSMVVMVGFGSSVAASLLDEFGARSGESFPSARDRCGMPDAEHELRGRNRGMRTPDSGLPQPADTDGRPLLPVPHPSPSTNDAPPVTATLAASIADPWCFQEFDLTLTLGFAGIRLGKNVRIEGLPGDEILLREPFRELPAEQEIGNGEVRETRRYTSRVRALTAGMHVIQPELLVPFIDPRPAYDLEDDETTRRIHMEPLRLSVRPLPESDRPTGFSGAVGSFAFRVAADPTNVVVENPVSVVMRIAGRGYIREMAPPQVTSAPHFRISDPEPATPRSSEIAAYRQTVVPQSTNACLIPPITFAYFDPAIDRYVTLVEGPFKLQFNPKPKDEYARFAPSHSAAATFALPEGARIDVLETHGGWIKILVDKRIGWVPRDTVSP